MKSVIVYQLQYPRFPLTLHKKESYRLWNFMLNLMIHSTCLCVVVLKSFMKNLEKVGKIRNIQQYSEKISHFSLTLNMFFHVNRSEVKYLSTEKTLKNPRNLAYFSPFMKQVH